MLHLVISAYELFLAFFVWFTVLALALIVAVLIAGVFSYALVWWSIRFLCCMGLSDHKLISKISFEETRERYFKESFPAETSVVWHNIAVAVPPSSAPINVDISIVYCPCTATITEGSQEPQSLVVLHGVGSSATLLISSSLAALREKYHVYVVDIPGFGTSDTSARLDHLSPDACLTFYAQCFDQLMNILNLKRPIVVAHSVGAFLVVNSVWHWSRDRIGPVILVSPAGILPTLSEAGAYWALLFFAGIPMSLFRFFGDTFGTFLFVPILSKPSCPRTSYWLQVQASMTMVNIPAQFISLGFASSYWNRPQLSNILQSKLDFGMVWGDKDVLMPISTGQLLVRLGEKIGKRFVLEPVAGAGHSPFHMNGGADFVAALDKVILDISAGEAGAGDTPGVQQQQQGSSFVVTTADRTVNGNGNSRRGGDSATDPAAAGNTTDSTGADTSLPPSPPPPPSPTAQTTAPATPLLSAAVAAMTKGQWRSSFSTACTGRRIADLHRHIEQAVEAEGQVGVEAEPAVGASRSTAAVPAVPAAAHGRLPL